MKMIDIIVPCFNEEECVPIFAKAIEELFDSRIDGYDYSIIYIDDGSQDNTLKEIKKVVGEYGEDKIKYISFSRNFGKEAALYVGLQRSTGDYVVPMDADLQHPPELLVEMIQAMEEGYDCAAARRISRKGEPFIRSVLSKMFYKSINRLVAIDLVAGSTDFRMMTRQVVDVINEMDERERFTKGIYSWIGFQTKWIEYANVKRVAGKTKWSFKRLFNYASSGFIAFATTPLRTVIYLGTLITIAAVIYAITVGITAYRDPTSRTGYASLMIAILLIGGVIIFTLGLIGEYMARIYVEIKHRPIYIEKDSSYIKKNHEQKNEKEDSF